MARRIAKKIDAMHLMKAPATRVRRSRAVPVLSEEKKELYSKIRPMTLGELDAALVKAGLKKK
ncbi:hypothetical protein KTD26_26675 [Burkholderia multivorans]|nr:MULTISPECIES: hypothetical protein [Burkholderia cepacia complex]MBU9146102.1 hypothetical protein [Burkholderia multivorans]HEF4772997.1 hypothetical protein [Burkholderia multivorans]